MTSCLYIIGTPRYTSQLDLITIQDKSDFWNCTEMLQVESKGRMNWFKHVYTLVLL